MKKRVLALMLVLGMTFSLAACGSSNDKKSDDTKTETTDKDSKEKMTTVKWNYGSSGNVLVTIAEEEGYFEDEGIEIEPVEATQNMDAMALLAAGKVDVVSNAGTSNPLQQIAQGVDLTIFGGHMVEGCMPVACMIFLMPMVYAWRGTSSSEAKKRLLASIVLSVRSTQ